MVRASQLLLRDGLQVNHLHLLVGTSMGCMEGWLWAETNPDDIDSMMLLSCLPSQIASRNRMVRKIMMDDIRLDPGWNGGNYTQQPYGLRAALGHLLVVGSAPRFWQRRNTLRRRSPINTWTNTSKKTWRTTDANDLLYQYDASRNYDASKDLGKITGTSIDRQSGGRFWNPGELGIVRAGNQESEKRKICAAAVFRRIARPLYVFPGRGLAKTPR